MNDFQLRFILLLRRYHRMVAVKSGALPYVQGNGFVRGERVGVRLDTDAGHVQFDTDLPNADACL